MVTARQNTARVILFVAFVNVFLHVDFQACQMMTKSFTKQFTPTIAENLSN